MTCVNYCEIVGKIIDSTVGVVANQKNISLKEACHLALQHIDNNSANWMSGCKPQIPYSDPLCRIAYLYSIVPANASLLENVLEVDRYLEPYLDSVCRTRHELNICAFGGGPGTELLGLVKRIERRMLSEQVALNFLLLDQVGEWVDTWYAMRKRIEECFRNSLGANRANWPVLASGSFSPVDFTRQGNYANLGALFDQDLHILSYVVSEVFDDPQNLSCCLSLIAERSASGSRVLFIDRREQRWKDEIEELAQNAGITLSNFHDTDGNMTTDEEKSELGSLYAYLGGIRKPRLTWQSFWVVGTVP